MHVSENHHVEVEATISFILFCFIFFCIDKLGAISAMHVQRMYNSATYFQLRDGTGPEPLTSDPTLFDLVTRPGRPSKSYLTSNLKAQELVLVKHISITFNRKYTHQKCRCQWSQCGYCI